ncbi:hypothetical protein ACHWQZ_G007334 [Mnemiopsis leidyi]
MTHLLVLCAVVLVQTCYSGNVLVIAGLQGSHLYVSTDVAEKIAGFGHNVTLLTLRNDSRVNIMDRGFHFVAFGKEGPKMESFLKRWDNAFKHFIHHPSDDMIVEFMRVNVQVEEVLEWGNDFKDMSLDYFQGEEFSELLNTGKFDLIVLEDSASFEAMVPLSRQDIPIMGIYCVPAISDARDRLNLPGLANSEPRMFNDVTDSSPTFSERFKNVIRKSRLLLYIIQAIQALEVDVGIEELFIAIYDVAFVLDHSSYSFPFISPPNTFYLGPFNLQDLPLSPLPIDYHEFIANCPHKNIVFFSFGSYLVDIATFRGTPAIIQTLQQLDACVIMKSQVDLSPKFDLPAKKFLQKAWVPQKDLLGSGKLAFFISHCGNNGRMEAIFYGVPLLCIPLFGDQYFNARLVERNKFGLLHKWEELTESSLMQTVKKLLEEKETFVTNMKKATEIATNDPGAGIGALKFYTDLLEMPII